MSLGGRSQPQQTTTNTSPWGPQQQYILDVFENAREQYNRSGPQYFQGQRVAAQAPETLTGLNMAASTAGGAGVNFAEQMLRSAAFNLGEGLNVGANPYLQAAIQTATRPIFQGLTDAGGPLQAARNNAVASGQFGGSRQGIAEGLAMSRATEQAGNVGAQMTNQAYQQALQQQLSTLLNGGNIMNAALTPANTLTAVGQQRMSYEQALIDDLIQKWNFEQNLPLLKLQNYANLVGGNFGGASVGTVPGPRTGGLTGAMGGALSGAAAGSMIGGPLGAGVGAGIGGLIGLMG